MSIADGAWKRWFAPGGNGAHDDRSAAGNASGASSGQASHRRPPGERWQTSKNAFWNTTRYVLIAGMFALLLTMVILLNEVMTFHNGIVQQVGEPHARSVVLMLDEMNRNPEAYPEERALPVAELAVELDGVRRALHELELFGKIQPARGPAPEQAAGQAAAGTAGGSPAPSGAAEVSLDDQSRALQIRLDRLRDTLYSASPFVAVAAALKDLKSSVEDLERFEVEPAAEGDAGASAEGAGDGSATVALEGQIKRMQDELDTLARGVRALPHADILSGHLANLKGQIEQLQSYQYATNLRRVPGDGEAAEAVGTGGPVEMVGSTGGVAQAALNEPAGGEFAAAAPPAAAQANAEIEKAAAAGGRAPAADGAITSIGENTKNMERDLRAAFPHFSLFAAVSDQVQAMRDQAGAFDGMTGADYRGAIDEALDREAAEARFDQTRDELGKAINQVENSIQGRTRVIALANVIRRNPDLSDAGASAMARTILHDFDALERFLPIVMPLQWVAPADWGLARVGIAPKRLATLSTDSIQTIYIFMIGAIGSLLFITRYHLELAIQGRGLGSAPTRPIAWLLFRPFFGIVVAFAVYLLVRAGQFAFGTGTEDGVGTDLNIPILSVVALFAGLLAWQALEAIEARGRLWFSSQTRKPLWASGLDHALRTGGHTIAECGHQIGRSPEQVERWLLFRDKVPVELQDRIRTWLEKSLNELFGENKPVEELGGRPMWAVGLKAALDNREKRLDEAGLAELLHEEKRDDNLERIRKWINLKLQVSPAMQWQLVDRLEVPHSQLFAPVLQDRDIWAPHLRHVIESRGERAHQVADRLGLDVERIHAWKELEAAVPTAMQDRLISTLERGFTALFEPEPKEPDWLIMANGLGQAIDRKYGKRDLDAFAAEVDVDVARIQDWIDRKKAVAKDTQKTIERVLGPAAPDDLFSPPRLGS